MNNIEYIYNKLKEHYPNKKIDLSEPRDKFNGVYILDIEHVVVTWTPAKPYRFDMSADFDPNPLYTSAMDIRDEYKDPDAYIDKIIGFVDNRLITTRPYPCTPEEYRNLFPKEKEKDVNKKV